MFTRSRFRKYINIAIFSVVFFIPMQLAQLNFQKYAEKKHWDIWFVDGKMLNFFSIINTHYYWGLLGFLLGCGLTSWIFKYISETENKKPTQQTLMKLLDDFPQTSLDLDITIVNGSIDCKIRSDKKNITHFTFYTVPKDYEIKEKILIAMFISFEAPFKFNMLSHVDIEGYGCHITQKPLIMDIKDINGDLRCNSDLFELQIPVSEVLNLKRMKIEYLQKK